MRSVRSKNWKGELRGEAYIGNGFDVLVENFGIVGATLELCNVFFLLETHEDSMREALAVRAFYAACIQETYVCKNNSKYSSELE